jgi:hypothetical protein
MEAGMIDGRYTMRRMWPQYPEREDYVFVCNGEDVGRCYLDRFPDGDRWQWTIYGSNLGALELTLDDAKAEFCAAFERVSAEH